MDFLKKPFVAVVLSVLIVLSSTLVSTNIRLGKKCDKITDSFYAGAVTRSGGSSIASEIKDICAAAEELSFVAADNGIDFEKTDAAVDLMRESLAAGDVSYAYQLYVHLLKTVGKLENGLSACTLSERDARAVDEYMAEIDSSAEAISLSDYNDSVRQFYREQLRFPAQQLAKVSGVKLPELFE